MIATTTTPVLSPVTPANASPAPKAPKTPKAPSPDSLASKELAELYTTLQTARKARPRVSAAAFERAACEGGKALDAYFVRVASADTKWAEGFGTLCAKIARIGTNNPGASIRVSHTNGKTGETRTVPVNGRGLIQAIGRDGDTILSGKLA